MKEQEETVYSLQKKINNLFEAKRTSNNLFTGETKTDFVKILKVINEKITEEEKIRAQNTSFCLCLFEDCKKCKKLFQNFEEREGEGESICPLRLKGKIKKVVPEAIMKNCIVSKETTIEKICEKTMTSIGIEIAFRGEKGFLRFIKDVSFIITFRLKDAFNDEELKEELYKLFEKLTGLKI